MFNNLININDFAAVWKKFKTRGPAHLIGKLFIGKSGRIKQSWKHTGTISSHWWDIAEVRKRWNLLITGASDTSYIQYAAEKYLPATTDLMGLSLGCGIGNKEIEWVKFRPNLSLTGIDISPHRQ